MVVCTVWFLCWAGVPCECFIAYALCLLGARLFPVLHTFPCRLVVRTLVCCCHASRGAELTTFNPCPQVAFLTRVERDGKRRRPRRSSRPPVRVLKAHRLHTGSALEQMLLCAMIAPSRKLGVDQGCWKPSPVWRTQKAARIVTLRTSLSLLQSTTHIPWVFSLLHVSRSLL